MDSQDQVISLQPIKYRLVHRNPAGAHGPKWYRDGESRRLIAMLFLTASYFLVELVWGLSIGSLALVADAMHMLSDLIGMAIGLYSLRVSKKGPTNSASFGMQRMEVVGALVNSAFLVGVSFIIILESVTRFFEASDSNLESGGTQMLIVGAVGLLINIIGLFVLSSGGNSHGHSHSHGAGEQNDNQDHSAASGSTHRSVNTKAVLLHVAGDALGSVGVVVSGLAIRYSSSSSRLLADPLCSLFISALICASAIPLSRQCMRVLLQAAPTGINLHTLKAAIQTIPGVLDVHELHIWELTPGRIVGSLHVKCREADAKTAISDIKILLHSAQVHSTTIQSELVDADGHFAEQESEVFRCEEPVCERDCTDKACCAGAVKIVAATL